MFRRPFVPPVSVVGPAALVGAFLPTVAAAQTTSVHALLKTGQTLPNNETVLSVVDHDIGGSGRWAAIVGTTGGMSIRRSLVSNGAILMTVGVALPGGETVAGIQDVAVSRDGTLGVLYEVQNPVAPTGPLERLRIGSQVVLAEGDTLSIGGLTPQDEIERFSGFDLDGQHLIVGLRTRTSGGLVKRAIVNGTLGPGGFTPTDAIVEGDYITDLTEPFEAPHRDLDIADSGASCATVELDDGGATLWAAIVDDRGIAQEGEPGPAPNSTWDLAEAPRARVNRFGEYAVGGRLELANGATGGVLYKGTQPIVAEGGGLNGVVGLVVAPFTTPAFELTDGGGLIFTVPFTSGSERLMLDSTTLLNTASDTIDGEPIASLIAPNLIKSVSATHDGRSILLTVDLAHTGPALLILEREIAQPTTCTPVPNSTLDVGRLTATGSRYITIDDLTITATHLPADAFGYLLTSRMQGLIPNPGGSPGHLCITGSIGRFITQTTSSGPTGTITTQVRPQSLPQPTGAVPATHGESWTFQLWHRDASMGLPTSNFTESISITFQ